MLIPKVGLCFHADATGEIALVAKERLQAMLSALGDVKGSRRRRLL
jgi:hypothetical protein